MLQNQGLKREGGEIVVAKLACFTDLRVLFAEIRIEHMEIVKLG